MRMLSSHFIISTHISALTEVFNEVTSKVTSVAHLLLYTVCQPHFTCPLMESEHHIPDVNLVRGNLRAPSNRWTTEEFKP